ARAVRRGPRKDRHMDDSDIYIVDTRNADHRHPGSTPWRPGAPARPVQTVYAQPSRVYAQPQPQVIYAQPPQMGLASNIFGKVTPGQLVDLVAQIFAALMPLPGAPV